MTAIRVFTTLSTRWVETVNLDGVNYRLRVWFNSRESTWYIDIFDQNEVTIVGGIKLVPSVFLLTKYRSVTNLPAGNLFLFDSDQNDQSAVLGLTDLGVRFTLLYFSAAEIAQLSGSVG